MFGSAIVLGIAARVICLLNAPRYGYPMDHLDYMVWADWAKSNGVLSVYQMPPRVPINMQRVNPRTGQKTVEAAMAPHAFNYPPAGSVIFWLQGWLWHSLDQQEYSTRFAPELAAAYRVSPDAPVVSRAANTLLARTIASLPSVLCDFLLAWAVVLLVRAVAGTGSPVRDALTFAGVLLAPPIFLDSALWNQTDSWIACLLVACVLAMLRRRFMALGWLYGLALMVKPQAILLAPVLVYWLLCLRFHDRISWPRVALAAGKSGVTALLAVGLITLPFAIHDARAGQGWANWWNRSYVSTVIEGYPLSTANAFNVWWLERMQLLAAGDAKVPRATDPVAGLSRDTLGRGALFTCLLATMALCARRGRWTNSSVLVLAALTLLAAFVLPTRVHDRYIYFSVPFIVALTGLRPRWGLVLLLICIAGTAEMTWPQWLPSNPSWRSTSTGMAILACLALAISLALAALPGGPSALKRAPRAK